MIRTTLLGATLLSAVLLPGPAAQAGDICASATVSGPLPAAVTPPCVPYTYGVTCPEGTVPVLIVVVKVRACVPNPFLIP